METLKIENTCDHHEIFCLKGRSLILAFFLNPDKLLLTLYHYNYVFGILFLF